MDCIINEGKLVLHYTPGKGSWTYHIRIPNSKHIKGKWGDIKGSGLIDNYKIENKNLAPIKGEDKMLTINADIRKAINKDAGEILTVTLYLLPKKRGN
jgi:LEA14-like dessication related protein